MERESETAPANDDDDGNEPASESGNEREPA